MTPERLDQLLARYFDGSLTPSEMEELDVCLQSDAAAQQAFWREAWSDAGLRQWGEEIYGVRGFEPSALDEVRGPDLVPGSVEISPGRHRFTGRRVLAAAAVLLIAVAGWMLYALLSNKSGNSGPSHGELGILADALEATWSGEGSLTQGAALQCKTYRLSSGNARFDLANGVTLWLRGPVTLDLQSTGRVALQAGAVAARVPPAARGFIVDLSGMSVTDLGTQFGVGIDASGTAQVHVFAGQVRLDPAGSTSAPSTRLNAGQAYRWSSDGQLTAIPLDYSTFAGMRLADVTVDFKGLPADHRPISGNHRGIDFGATGAQGWGAGLWKGEMALDLHADSKTASQTITLPPGTTLKRIKMQSDLGDATVTLRSAGNPDVTFERVPAQYTEYRTGWTKPAAQVTVTITASRAASDVDITEITYGLP